MAAGGWNLGEGKKIKVYSKVLSKLK